MAAKRAARNQQGNRTMKTHLQLAAKFGRNLASGLVNEGITAPATVYSATAIIAFANTLSTCPHKQKQLRAESCAEYRRALSLLTSKETKA
jgi:hypothetical protein